MSAEIINVTAEAVRNASFVARLKNVANAHPISAAVVGTATVGFAAFGAYKVARSVFKSKPVVPVVVVPTEAPKAP